MKIILGVPLKDITEAYRDEYYEKVSATQQGWLGKINRLFNKLPGHDKAESRFFATAVIVGAPLFVLAVFVPALMTAAVILTGAASIASLGIHAVVCKKTSNAMTTDIRSGILGKRYAEEFLKPKNDAALQPAIEKLSAPLTAQDKVLVSAFDACAPDAAESKLPDAKPATAALKK